MRPDSYFYKFASLSFILAITSAVEYELLGTADGFKTGLFGFTVAAGGISMICAASRVIKCRSLMRQVEADGQQSLLHQNEQQQIPDLSPPPYYNANDNQPPSYDSIAQYQQQSTSNNSLERASATQVSNNQILLQID